MKAKNFIRPLIGTLILLIIPLVGTLTGSGIEGNGWHWTPFDFVLMGAILYIAGLFFEFFASRSNALAYKAGSALGVLTGLLVVWVTLAVGIIGEDNPANLMYFGVVLIGIIGAFVTNLQAKGMMYTAIVVAIAQMAVPTIAYLVSNIDFSPGVAQVFGLNAAFALMWLTSGLLFSKAASSSR